MPYESVHLQMEKIETSMVVWFVGYVGEHGPLDEKKMLDELVKKRGIATFLGGYARLFQRVREEGIAEQGPDGLWHLTTTGEGLYIVARGKLPKSSKSFQSITPTTAARIKAAYDESRSGEIGQKEASE